MCQDGRLKKDAGLWAIFAFWLSLFLSLFFEKVSFYSEICSMLILTNKMHACFMSCVPLNSHSTNISLPAFPIFSFWLRAGVVCWLMKFSGFFRIHVQCVKRWNSQHPQPPLWSTLTSPVPPLLPCAASVGPLGLSFVPALLSLGSLCMCVCLACLLESSLLLHVPLTFSAEQSSSITPVRELAW